MKKLAVLFFTTLTMLNCKNQEEKTENAKPEAIKSDEKKADSLVMGNYLFDDEKNLITFVIEKNGDEIKGYLTYQLAEKDRNSGKFSGKFDNGILLGKYTFKSEGKESVREVAFKLDGDKLIEGYGVLNEDGTAFKDVSKLIFDSKMPLSKINGVFE
ncbi:MAG: hypothetical protein V4666_02780 [Bacteroidota bacterium]